MQWDTLVIAGAALAVAQLVKGITGFGSALVAMPVLLMLLDPAEAILVMVATDLFAGAWLVNDVWPRIRWVLVGAMFIGVLPGQWIGTELLEVLDVFWVKRILGTIVVVLGATFALWPVVEGVGELEDLPESPGPMLGLGAIAGFFAGVMSGLVGAAGPPVIAYCKRYFENQFYRAQLVTLFELSGIALAIMLVKKGADFTTLKSVPLLLVPVLLGNRVGAYLAPRVSKTVFGRATGIVLVGAGVALFL